MSCQLEQTGPAAYRLDGDFCVHHAADLLPQWLGLAAGTPVTVDLGGVAEIDTAGVQLLVLLKRLAPAAVSYCNASAAVSETLGLVDLTMVLSDESRLQRGGAA